MDLVVKSKNDELAENWDLLDPVFFKTGCFSFWESIGEARSDQLLPIFHTGVPRKKILLKKITNLV